MSEKRDILGLWWFPAKPNERFVGTLALKTDMSPKLVITVQKSFFEFFTGDSTPPSLIQGCDDGGKPISLVTPSWPRSSGGSALTQVGYSANYAILNLALSCADDFRVNSYSIQLQHLPGWYGTTGFLRKESAPDDDWSFHYKRPAKEVFNINEDLSLEFRVGCSLQNGSNEKKLKEEVNVTFVSKNGLDLAQCKACLNDFRLLLHFSTLEENYPLKITATKDGHGHTHEEKFYPHDIEIWNSIIKEDVETDWHPDGWIFKFADVRQSFSEFFSGWMKLTNDYEEALNSYCATVYHSLPREIEHICITQALDAYHGIKFASHEQRNFCGKIEQLAEMHKEHLKGLVDDVPEFAKTVLDNRNYYTHHNPKYLKAGRVVTGAKLIRLNEKLKLIFQMCILTEMGISVERFSRLRRQLADDIIELG